jgi:outer membrane cobalamin receptor
MKFGNIILLILFITPNIGVTQDISNMKISCDFENQPLKDVLDRLEKELNIKFTYMNKMIKNRFVTISFDNIIITTALNTLFNNTNLSYKIHKGSNNIVIYNIRNLVIKGHVFDAETKLPVHNTTVYLNKVQKRVSTNKDGFFQLPVDKLPVKIKIQHSGYEIKIITVTENSNQDLKIPLEPQVIRLLSGVVRDINTYQEIPGVNIFIEKAQLGAITDEFGKYELRLTGVQDHYRTIFKHVAYIVFQISLDSLNSIKTVYLQPRIIPLQTIRIEGKTEEQSDITNDLPQPISIIEAKAFEMRGFIDAGDLLKTDHSIQVDEQLSGKKTIAIRGGNPDEVVVMYNGVKMNSSYDNVFDFSMIDMDDIQKVEIIRGSNTSLFGPEALSGVINIVPKLKQDYNIRFQQRFGTYRSGNWGIHLYHGNDKYNGTYSIKRGAYKRGLIGFKENNAQLINNSVHHKGYFKLNLAKPTTDKLANSISTTVLRSSQDYTSQQNLEKLTTENNLYSFLYSGDFLFFENFKLSTSLRKLDEIQSQSIESNVLDRKVDDEAIFIRSENLMNIGMFDLLFAYNYQNSKLIFSDILSAFDSKERFEILESSELRRSHHGFASIIKFNIGRVDEETIYKTNFDLSFRYDKVRDEQQDRMIGLDDQNMANHSGIGLFDKNNWDKTTVKFSVNLTGYRENLNFINYINYGRNVKFPTLFQQLGIPTKLPKITSFPNLNPEENSSIEIGTSITGELPHHPKIFGWQISGNYFMNDYSNKFRTFKSPHIPVAYYDNIQNARISGFEVKNSLFLFKKKVTFELSFSRYSISEKAAFPFKSDFKTTANILLDHSGWAVQLHAFRENDQTGWLHYPNDNFTIVTLPGYANIDLHINKKLDWFGLTYFLNFSGRNLLDDDTILQGLAIRDRRFYLTFGVQY